MKNEAKEVPYLKLPFKDKRKLVRHYKKKLKFYALQDSTKWQQWPVKTLTKINSNKEQKKKDKNHKKKKAKRNRTTLRDAQKALESGAVVVLTEDEVPPGAIAVLGKGLGYVPTPTTDDSEERLQMRQTVNRIISESRKRCTEEFTPPVQENIPPQLRSTTYNQREPAPDKQVNTILERLVTAHDAALLNNKKNLRGKTSKRIFQRMNLMVYSGLRICP